MPITRRAGAVWRLFWGATAACCLLEQRASAQPAFEVASVKPSQPASRMEIKRVSPGHLTMQNVSLISMIRLAYRLNDHQVSGPDWINTERYEVVAKASGPAKGDEMRLMLRKLLAERFKLATHRVTKKLPLYVMTVDKKGHKLQPAPGDEESDFKPGRTGNMMSAVTTNTSMAELAILLSEPLQRTVVDKTRVKGKFNFVLDLTPYMDVQGSGGQPGRGMDIPYMTMMAVKDQLGLKFKPETGPVEMLIVDSAEKVPVQN